MPCLVQLLDDHLNWRRVELPEESLVLLSTGTDPDEHLVLTGVDGCPDVTGSPKPLALIQPWSRAGRHCHLHYSLLYQSYRNAELTPLHGVVVLRDRDCLTYRVDGRLCRVSYDAFTAPKVRSYAGEPLECAYCRQLVSSGTSVVECPGCGIVFHQAEGAGCWLASDQCPNCGHPIPLEQVSDWIPQDFGHLVLEMNDDSV